MTERQLRIICYFIWFFGRKSLYTFNEIFHHAERMATDWMPLPEPPEEKQNEDD